MSKTIKMPKDPNFGDVMAICSKILHKMNNEELKRQIVENETLHIADVMHSLRNDPNVDEYTKDYDNTEKYLRELIEKDGSLMYGIVNALETYLEK